MPRTVEIAAPSEQTTDLVREIEDIDGLISLRVEPGISRKPPGDVITVELIVRSLPELMRLLDGHGITDTPSGSVSISQPTGIISSEKKTDIANDISELSWEEMEILLVKGSNMTANGLAVMGVAGVLATIGIATGALHLVIGAMVIAPGFEPLVRCSLGLVAHGRTWRRGALDTAQGYFILIVGAAAAALLMQALGKLPPQDTGAYLSAATLLSYWTTITPTAGAVSAAGGAAGAALVAANREVLTSGVMIALALIPSAALIGVGLILQDWGLVLAAFLRWGFDVVIVIAASLLVFWAKQLLVHRRKMRL